MKTKKAKALALELMDDLLGKGEKDQKGSGEKKSKSQSSSTGGKKGSSRPKGEPVSLKEATRLNEEGEPSIDLDLEESNPFLIHDSTPSSAESPAASETTKIGVPEEDTKVAHNPDDATVRLSESKIVSHPDLMAEGLSKDQDSEVSQSISSFAPPTQTSAPMPNRFTGLGGVSSPAQVSLVQSENLRIAQQRILELEEELSRLRTDNEALAAAGETLKSVSDRAKGEVESLKRQIDENKDAHKQETTILNRALKDKQKQTEELEQKVSEMEMRLSTSIQKIRVRERELENRLELVRMEGQALIRNKDEMILDLKRQIDQLTIELESYRAKGQDLNKQLDDKQQMLSRTVKALRLALSLLEGNDGSGKKAS
jgi:vacuolar-type H+-ATPase subunit I/STV1